MRNNHVRERLRRGEPTLGSFLGLGSPNVAEMMAHAGFDWLVIETEHNALDTAETQHMLMAMSGTDVIPIIVAKTPKDRRTSGKTIHSMWPVTV